MARAFNEIEADVKGAVSKRDADALVHLCAELDEEGSPISKALSLLTRGQAATYSGQLGRGLDLGQQAKSAYALLGNKAGVAASVTFIAGSCNERGDYSEALNYFQEALDLYAELGDRANEAAVTRNLGMVHFSMGDHPAALLHFNHALEMFEELGDDRGVARTHGNIGIIYATTGDYPAALEMLHKAIRISEDIDDRLTIAIYAGNIGNVLSAAGSYTEALDYFQRSLKLSEEFGDDRGVAFSTGNIGEAYRLKGDQIHALEYLRRALEMHRKLEDVPRIALVTANICMTLIDLDMLDEARVLLDELRSIDLDDPAIRVDRHTIEARLEEHAGDLDRTYHCYTNALAEAEKFNLRSHSADLHKALRDLAFARRDLDGYVHHNDAYLNITEQIKGREATLKIGILEKEREILAERREKELHQAALYATLPKHVADRVVHGETISDHYDDTVVIFLDVVDFTSISDRIPPSQVIHLLDAIFNVCDEVIERHDLTKIKTIGDSYMAAAFPVEQVQETTRSVEQLPVIRSTRATIELMNALDNLHIEMPKNLGDVSWITDHPHIEVRIGMHVGHVVAGIIGAKRLQYDVWGDTVNVASRMESTSEPGHIQVSEAFARHLMDDAANNPQLNINVADILQLRGEIEVKGKGLMKTYWISRNVN